jgi:hypothetical protein
MRGPASGPVCLRIGCGDQDISRLASKAWSAGFFLIWVLFFPDMIHWLIPDVSLCY